MLFSKHVFPNKHIIAYIYVLTIILQVHDILHFLPCDQPSQVRFIWSSEKSGFRHLYLVTARLSEESPMNNSENNTEDCHFDSSNSGQCHGNAQERLICEHIYLEYCYIRKLYRMVTILVTTIKPSVLSAVICNHFITGN